MTTVDNYKSIILHNVQQALIAACKNVCLNNYSVDHVALGNKTVAVRFGTFVSGDNTKYYMVDNGEFRNRNKTRLFVQHADAINYCAQYLVNGTWRKNFLMVIS